MFKRRVCWANKLVIWIFKLWRDSTAKTINLLNETALYYLQSRGVSRTEAEVMMSFGFINELLEKIPEAAVHDYLQPRLAALFGRDQALLTIE